MSRGFHAFFRQYSNLRGLLRRTDPGLRRETGLPDHPLLHAGAIRDSFRHVPRTPPWSALGFAALSPAFTVRDLCRMDPVAALPLLDVRVPGIHDRLDHVSAHAFPDAVRCPEKARHLASEVFSRSLFADPGSSRRPRWRSCSTSTSSARRRACCSMCPARPSRPALWEPLAGYLRRHGAEVRTATAAEHIAPGHTGGYQVASDRDERHHDSVVLALDTVGLRHLVARSDLLGDARWRERIARLRNAPPFLVTRLWLDRPVAPERPGFLGTGGFETLDSVSVLERWEDEAAYWAARTGGPWWNRTPARYRPTPPGTSRRSV
ncbi:hypothetical protein GCM10010345_20480 [Streptomyces canarius]|uniref:Uncharacterized protein n=1 Tax=Streptomyces canarius TaxID=285453 RepID=A0ABQ3CLD7_9ACTN|nr:hypothetical protein GCM10010345_20480 [Streptomyces canarius]